MRINTESHNTKDNVKDYIQGLGCSVIRENIRVKNYTADMVGYTINNDRKLVPEVVVTITTTLNPNKQRHIFAIAKQFNVEYVLLVIAGEEIKKYWLDTRTTLTTDEPRFYSTSKWLVDIEDIEDRLIECLDILNGLYRPFSKLKIILCMLLIRKYVSDTKDLEGAQQTKLNAIKYYKLKDIYDFEEVTEELFKKLFDYMKVLSPTNEDYPNVIIKLIERFNAQDIGYHVATNKLTTIVTKIINSLNITHAKAIDLCTGLGFQVFNIMKSDKVDSYMGIEINQEINIIANTLKIISGYENVTIIAEDALAYTIKDYFDLVTIEPPIGPITIEKRYEDFDITNGTMKKRRRVDHSELFIEKAINVAKPKGYIIAVVPEGILFTSPSEVVRHLILNKTIIKAIISLPEQINVPYSGINLSILVLERKEIETQTAEHFFVGKIDSIEDTDKVIDEFEKWIRKED